MNALEQVGSITIAPRALKHRHVLEAAAIATVFDDDDRPERIIGTDNKSAPHAQIYGWGRNVQKHVDDTGWIYFSPLMLGETVVHTRTVSLKLEQFKVYRLNDYCTHWTEDTATVICLLAGVFPEPDDAAALAMMQAGANSLARGALSAPRVSKGFRVQLGDEVYAEAPQGTLLVSLAAATARNWVIATCARCDKYAVRVDAHFPYHWENNRCRMHLKAA